MIQQTTTLWATIKAKATKLFSAAFFYLSPIHVLMFMIGTAIIIDTYIGRWAAKKKAIKEGKDVRLEVTSRKTREGFVSKMIAYQVAIILLFVLDKYLFHDLLMYFLPTFPIKYAVTKVMGVVLLLIEFDSIDEHYYNVTGKRIKEIIREKIRSVKKTIIGAKNFKDEIEE